jgi:hypothetical protein
VAAKHGGRRIERRFRARAMREAREQTVLPLQLLQILTLLHKVV